MKKLKEFIPLWKLIKEEKLKLILTSLLLFIVSIVTTIYGYLVGQIVASITNNNLHNAIIYSGIYLIAGILFDSVITHWVYCLLQNVENKLARKMGYNTYSKALNLPAIAYEEKKSGEIINRITGDADTLSYMFEEIIEFLGYLFSTIIVTIYIVNNSWIIGLEILLFLFIMIMIMKKYSPLLEKAHKEKRSVQDDYSSLVNESIRGIREIKTLGIKKNLLSDMTKIIKDLYLKSKNEIDTRFHFHTFSSSVKYMLQVVIFLTCAILLYNKQINLAFFISMTYYVYQYTWLIDGIKNMTDTYQRLTVSLERINEILENKLHQDDKFGIITLDKPIGKLTFNNVTFGYPNEKNTLNKFNLIIEPNKKIAIVGSSGQGKSTLFNLLTRIFDPNDGEILLDNTNIKDLAEDSLRNIFSVIRQEPFIFNRSIIDNFKLVDENITLKSIRKYTKMAYLDEYIMSLPNKYKTILGEGGVNLSGGQKQRLAIARTLAKNSKVILFDEATSALDNNSQEYVKKSIDNLVSDHTVVIVAHRLSTIVDSDIIYVVDKGQVVASGSHQELLNNSPIYNKLYSMDNQNATI